jgi:hypothetical protein
VLAGICAKHGIRKIRVLAESFSDYAVVLLVVSADRGDLEIHTEIIGFDPQDGKRSAILILNLQDASQIAAMAEPWFLAFNAEIEATPVMLAEDLQKAAPAIQQAVKAYA